MGAPEERAMLTTVAVIGLVVVVGTVGLALGLGPAEAEPQPTVRIQTEQSRFFVLGGGSEPAGEVPMEVLLARLEQHVRHERAAVEGFPERPRAEDLRTKTTSPLTLN